MLMSKTYRVPEVEDFQQEVHVHQFGHLKEKGTKRELIGNNFADTEVPLPAEQWCDVYGISAETISSWWCGSM
jgi:hypothetical protein